MLKIAIYGKGGIGKSTIYSLYLFRVGDSEAYGIFQKIIDRNPIFSDGFHAYIKSVVINQPLLEL